MFRLSVSTWETVCSSPAAGPMRVPPTASSSSRRVMASMGRYAPSFRTRRETSTMVSHSAA